MYTPLLDIGTLFLPQRILRGFPKGCYKKHSIHSSTPLKAILNARALFPSLTDPFFPLVQECVHLTHTHTQTQTMWWCGGGGEGLIAFLSTPERAGHLAPAHLQ